MAEFSGQQRAEFAVLAHTQLSDGVPSCEYPQVNTLALQLGAYYTAVTLPLVTGVDITFNHALPQVVFKAHGRDWKALSARFPEKTLGQLKAFYQNWRKRLELDQYVLPPAARAKHQCSRRSRRHHVLSTCMTLPRERE